MAYHMNNIQEETFSVCSMIMDFLSFGKSALSASASEAQEVWCLV